MSERATIADLLETLRDIAKLLGCEDDLLFERRHAIQLAQEAIARAGTPAQTPEPAVTRLIEALRGVRIEGKPKEACWCAHSAFPREPHAPKCIEATEAIRAALVETAGKS